MFGHCKLHLSRHGATLQSSTTDHLPPIFGHKFATSTLQRVRKREPTSHPATPLLKQNLSFPLLAYRWGHGACYLNHSTWHNSSKFVNCSVACGQLFKLTCSETGVSKSVIYSTKTSPFRVNIPIPSFPRSFGFHITSRHNFLDWIRIAFSPFLWII